MDDLNLFQLIGVPMVKTRPPLLIGRALFDALVAAVKAGNRQHIQDASERLSSDYREFWDHRMTGDDAVLLARARTLLACATEAVSQPDDFRADTDRAWQVLKSGNGQTLWEWMTTRALLTQAGSLPVKVKHCVRVPIAFRREGKQKSDGNGLLALLEVRVLENGSGAVAHDPRDAFETRCGGELVEAVADAWNLARNGGTAFDGVWRILPWDVERFNARPEAGSDQAYTDAPVNGRSAGGAAARAWALALRGMVEDPGIICMLGVKASPVSAQSGAEDDAFDSVDGIAAKVAKVASDSNWFDTIVVSPDQRGPVLNNYTDAMKALGSAAARIRVIPM